MVAKQTDVIFIDIAKAFDTKRLRLSLPLGHMLATCLPSYFKGFALLRTT